MNVETPLAFRHGKRSRRAWTTAERLRLAEMWGKGAPIEEITDEFGCEAHRIYAKASQMGLPRRKGRLPLGVKLQRKAKKHGGSQRRFAGVQKNEDSDVKITLEPHDPRFRAGTTVFPTTVIPASKLGRLLKSGHNSRKIGKQVAKGRLRGAPIYTLTLEERATCPRSCKAWAVCYGNNMPFAHRIFDDGTLTKRLWGELASLQADNPNGFLIRLHVLGDFFSAEYVGFWRQALDEFAGLNIFGFTARHPPDPIGVALVELVRDQYERCRIRFSGLAMEEDGAVVIERREDAIGVLCPAESNPEISCGSCGLCWHSNRTISFMRH